MLRVKNYKEAAMNAEKWKETEGEKKIKIKNINI